MKRLVGSTEGYHQVMNKNITDRKRNEWQSKTQSGHFNRHKHGIPTSGRSNPRWLQRALS